MGGGYFIQKGFVTTRTLRVTSETKTGDPKAKCIKNTSNINHFILPTKEITYPYSIEAIRRTRVSQQVRASNKCDTNISLDEE